MSKAIRIHETGGPEVLKWEDVASPSPGPGEILIRQVAVGLNFIDVYFRTGLYRISAFPAVIGMEGAGIVDAVGDGVDDILVGDRVAYAGPLGAYAQRRVIRAERAVVLPAAISCEQAAAMMFQGMTAQYLLRRTCPVEAGDIVVVHAAAGGVGLILCQWAKHLGATVIGVVSTGPKAELARANGADHVLVGADNMASEIKKLTKGHMAKVVFDGTGRDTFTASLDCLAPCGLMVSYGNATGEVRGLDLSVLAAKGSLFVTRPTLATHIASRKDLLATAGALFEVVQSGAVKIHINQRFALSDAASAHRALEERRTTGSTILLP
jgi:NADPH2:quinone reductase